MFSKLFQPKRKIEVPAVFDEIDLANIRFALNYADGKIPAYSNKDKNDFVLLVAKLAKDKGILIPENYAVRNLHLID